MKTFSQFLTTRPAFEQPRDRDEFLRMQIAYTAAMLEASDFHYEEMMFATAHITSVLQ